MFEPMAGVPIAARIENLVGAVLAEQGIELLEVQYKKEQDVLTLRIFIDREEGVDLNVCTMATRAIQDMIDEDKIEYDQLEVSSPGPKRLLKTDKDLQRFRGERVKARTRQTLNGQKNFVGVLAAADEKYINIEADGKITQIPREMISIVRLDPNL